MNYTPKDYSKLLGMPGFSETLLKNHFTLYQGYVINTNKVLDILGLMAKDGKTAAPEYAELKRRLGWEFNGMRLHELYFENLGGRAPLDPAGKLGGKLIGWAVLYEDTTNGRLINFWVNEHDVSHPAGCAPLLIMDVFEHAFMIDYGLKRADYIEAFFKNVDWAVVGSRLK